MEALRLLQRPKLTHHKKVLQQSTNSSDELRALQQTENIPWKPPSKHLSTFLCLNVDIIDLSKIIGIVFV